LTNAEMRGTEARKKLLARQAAKLDVLARRVAAARVKAEAGYVRVEKIRRGKKGRGRRRGLPEREEKMDFVSNGYGGHFDLQNDDEEENEYVEGDSSLVNLNLSGSVMTGQR